MKFKIDRLAIIFYNAHVFIPLKTHWSSFYDRYKSGDREAENLEL